MEEPPISYIGIPPRANFELDETEINNISASLKSLKDKLADVRTSLIAEKEVMAIHEKKLAELSSTEQKLRQSIILHEALLEPSAIRNLPFEVLSQIFLHHLQIFIPAELSQFERSSGATYKNILLAQNLPLHVCRRWRSTAISDPRLWQTVCLFLPKDSPSISMQEHWGHLEERIGYSRSFTINLLTCHMIDSRRIGFDTERHQTKMISLLFTLLPRASQFFLSHKPSANDAHGSFRRPFSLFRDHEAAVYNHLAEMRISLGAHFRELGIDRRYLDWYRSIAARSPHMHTLDAPSLNVFALSSARHPNLVTLRIYDSTVTDLATLLRVSPQLENIHLDVITRSDEVINVVRQNKLSHLRVDNAKGDFLEALTLPGLTHLQLSVNQSQSGRTPSWPTPEGVRFFARSDCMLQSLMVYDSAISLGIIHILRPQSALSVLEFLRPQHTRHSSTFHLPTEFLDFLENIGDYLPSLTNFSLAIGGKQVQKAYNTLNAILDARKEGREANANVIPLEWRLWIMIRTTQIGYETARRTRLVHEELLQPAVDDLKEYGVNVLVRHR